MFFQIDLNQAILKNKPCYKLSFSAPRPPNTTINELEDVLAPYGASNLGFDGWSVWEVINMYYVLYY